jgi:hypothetical protein
MYRCLLQFVRGCSDPEECAETLRCVQRGVEVARPPTIDASLWAAWKKKDKNLLLLLLEARVEQLRDYKSGSPTYRVGKDKLEAVLRLCENLMQAQMQAQQGQSSSDASPAQDAAKQGALTLRTKNLGVGAATGDVNHEDLAEITVEVHLWFAVEVHLWLASAAFAHACSISSDSSNSSSSNNNIDMAIASSHEALEHVANAKIAVGIAQGLSPLSCSHEHSPSMEGEAVLPKMLAVEGEALREALKRFAPGADFLAGRLGESERARLCVALSEVIRVKLKRQEEQQQQRAAEAEQVQRALEEQRKLEEEAKEVKRREADERQRKAREERQRKEVEKQHTHTHTHTHKHTHKRHKHTHKHTHKHKTHTHTHTRTHT